MMVVMELKRHFPKGSRGHKEIGLSLNRATKHSGAYPGGYFFYRKHEYWIMSLLGGDVVLGSAEA